MGIVLGSARGTGAFSVLTTQYISPMRRKGQTVENNLVTAISKSGGAIVHAINSTAIVAEMECIHRTSATASAALGRLLTAAALMGGILKNDADSVTIKVKGGGAAGTLTAICDSRGNVRGSIDNPFADAPLNSGGKLDVGGIVGTAGQLVVIRDTGTGEPYAGQVPLVSGEIAEDITRYYAKSEQIPTVCALGVLVNPALTIRAAGGFLLQLLPGAGEAEIALLEENIAGLDAVSAMIDGGMSPQEIAFSVLSGFSPEILHRSAARYQCNCCVEKMRRVMTSLGREELCAMADEQEETELVCSYCDKRYIFSADDLRRLAGGNLC